MTLEDIDQDQGSSHATHPLMLLIIFTKYGKNPSWTVDATGRTRKVNGQTDGQTDGRTDGQTDRQGESNIPPLTSLRGYNDDPVCWRIYATLGGDELKFTHVSERGRVSLAWVHRPCMAMWNPDANWKWGWWSTPFYMPLWHHMSVIMSKVIGNRTVSSTACSCITRQIWGIW